MINRLLTSCFISFATTVAAAAETQQPAAWDCLPAETAFALRIPNGSEFYDTLKGTLIGNHFLGEDRIDEFLAILEREQGENWRTFREKLSEFGLEPRDLPRVLTGESGAALVLEGIEDAEKPRQFIFFWAEPGEELGARAMDALMAAMEERDANYPSVRVDFRLAGHPVTHFADPQVIHDFEGNERVTHNAHTFLARKGGRILGAMTLLSGPDPMTARAAFAGQGDPLPDPEPEPGEEMLRVFARFLQAHDGEPGGFSRNVISTPGMREALPAGVPAFEMAVNPERIFAALLSTSDGDGPDLREMLDAAGLLDVGNSALRGAVDRGVFRWGGLLSAPAPRKGAISTFAGQQELAPRPLPWVPAHIVNYSHFSLDFGEFFSLVREIAVNAFGAEAEQGFQMLEMQVNGLLQADVATVLSSFGHRHTVLTFPPEETVGGNGDEAASQGFFLEDRSAMVWEVKDEALWQRVIQAAGMFAPMTGGALRPAEEQGFSGWRMETDEFEGGLLLGDGSLVLGIGKGTLEEVLSALRNPPAAEHTFASSSKFRDAQGLIDFRPGIYWDVQNAGKQLGDVARMIRNNHRAGGFDDQDRFSRESVEELIGLLDPDVIGEAFGMGVSQIFTTRDGIVLESAQYLAPAED